jgi:hypothetical protein
MQEGNERLRDLIMLETINTINEAFCDVHRRHCPIGPDVPGAEQMLRECARAAALSDEVRRDLIRIGDVPGGMPGALCVNAAGDETCKRWAASGDCDSNAGVYVHSAMAINTHHKVFAGVLGSSWDPRGEQCCV